MKRRGRDLFEICAFRLYTCQAEEEGEPSVEPGAEVGEEADRERDMSESLLNWGCGFAPLWVLLWSSVEAVANFSD